MDAHEHSPLRGCHGYPHPPAGMTFGLRRAAGEVPYGDPLHFWRDGPVTPMRLLLPHRVRLRDGSRRRCTHEVRWYLDRVEGVERARALERLYDVLLHPQGWSRAGVHWKRVSTRQDAAILVRVIPAAQTVCGSGAAGCYSYGYEPDGKPVAEMGVEYIDKPGAWLIITGMELCGHGSFKGEDMYTPDHQPYLGSMGTWQAAQAIGWLPTQAEIDGARAWLDGTLDPALIHH